MRRKEVSCDATKGCKYIIILIHLDVHALKETINQQEEEYEGEEKMLIASTSKELLSERQVVAKLRNLVGIKNTKLNQMKSKLLELEETSQARGKVIETEKHEKAKLRDVVENYKTLLEERGRELQERNKYIQELEANISTLEKAKNISEKQVDTLHEERKPIVQHVTELEKHIAKMYEELVVEYEGKKQRRISLETKDQKLNALQVANLSVKQTLQHKRATIESFQLDLDELLQLFIRNKQSSISLAAVEDMVRKLHRKYVGNKDSRNSSKESTNEIEGNDILASEAFRQRSIKEKEARSLQHRLQLSEAAAIRTSNRLVAENSELLKEVNELRQKYKALESKLKNSTQASLTAENELRTQASPLPPLSISDDITRNVSHNRVNLKAKGERHFQLHAERLSKEVDMLRQQLDDASCTRDMQALEINRLRKLQQIS